MEKKYFEYSTHEISFKYFFRMLTSYRGFDIQECLDALETRLEHLEMIVDNDDQYRYQMQMIVDSDDYRR